MASSSTPKPFLAVIAVLVAHAAFLLAPDMAGLAWILLLHGVAILTLFMIYTCLKGGTVHGDERVRLRCLVAGALADTLLLVGAGYSTSVEPGVIKLGGVLPLGWSCALLALMDELLRVYAQRRDASTVDRTQGERWLVLGIGAAIAMTERLISQEPSGLKGVLTALLFYGLFTCWRRYRQIMQQPVMTKE